MREWTDFVCVYAFVCVFVVRGSLGGGSQGENSQTGIILCFCKDL